MNITTYYADCVNQVIRISLEEEFPEATVAELNKRQEEDMIDILRGETRSEYFWHQCDIFFDSCAVHDSVLMEEESYNYENFLSDIGVEA